MKCYLCAIRVFFTSFSRPISQISLEDVLILHQDHRSQMVFQDPWVRALQIPDFRAARTKLTDISASLYPSPEKVKNITTYNIFELTDYKDFESSLFSVGVLGLQLLHLKSMDFLY